MPRYQKPFKEKIKGFLKGVSWVQLLIWGIPAIFLYNYAICLLLGSYCQDYFEKDNTFKGGLCVLILVFIAVFAPPIIGPASLTINKIACFVVFGVGFFLSGKKISG